MNIFYTDSDPVAAANQLAYVHIVKMITEYCQMICTRIRLQYGELDANLIYVLEKKQGVIRLKLKKSWYTLSCDKFIYRFGMKILISKQIMTPTHANHPCATWLRDDPLHELWVLQSAKRMCEIYTERTGRIHASERILDATLCYPSSHRSKCFVEPPMCVPEHIKDIAYGESVEFAYQLCLIEKYAEWGNRDKPIKVEFPCGQPHWYVHPDANFISEIKYNSL